MIYDHVLWSWWVYHLLMLTECGGLNRQLSFLALHLGKEAALPGLTWLAPQAPVRLVRSGRSEVDCLPCSAFLAGMALLMASELSHGSEKQLLGLLSCTRLYFTEVKACHGAASD